MNTISSSKNFVIVLVLSLLATGATISGCATTALSMPTSDQLVEMGVVETGADLASLERGRVIAIADCLGCHRQYWPQEFHEKRWPALAEDMGKLAGMTNKQIHDLANYMAAASQFEPTLE